MRTIRSKFLVTMSISIVIMLSLLGVLVVLQSLSEIRPFAESLTQEVAKARADEVARWIDGIKADIRIFAARSVFRRARPDEVRAYLRGLAANLDKQYESMYFTWPDGSYYTTKANEGSIADRDYFQQVISGQKDTVITDPVISHETKAAVIVIASAVKDPSGRVVGVLGATVIPDTLSTIVDNVKIGQKGFCAVIDGKGVLIAHPKRELALKLKVTQADGTGGGEGYRGLSALGQEMIKGKPGKGLFLNPKGEECLVLYEPIRGAPRWQLACAITMDDLMESVYSLMLVVAVLTIVILLALLGVTGILVTRLTKPIVMMVERSRDLAEGEGDLTKTVELETNDELASLTGYLNKFVGKIRNDVVLIKKHMQGMRKSTEELVTIAVDGASATEQISSQSQAIASATTEMDQSLQVLASSIEEMSISVSEVAKKSSEAAALAAEADEAAAETDKVVSALSVSANDIGRVVELIAGIAGQINLLALNAAIEAASAGDAGRGFAVVASEVKELAEQTASSTGEIKSRVGDIQQSTTSAVQAMQRIRSMISQVSEIGGSIASSVEEQSITTKEIASNVAQVSKASGEVSGNINSVAAGSAQNAAGVARLRELSNDISSIAEDLATVVGKFRVE